MRKFFAEGNRWTLDHIAKPYWPKCQLCGGRIDRQDAKKSGEKEEKRSIRILLSFSILPLAFGVLARESFRWIASTSKTSTSSIATCPAISPCARRASSRSTASNIPKPSRRCRSRCVSKRGCRDARRRTARPAYSRRFLPARLTRHWKHPTTASTSRKRSAKISAGQGVGGNRAVFIGLVFALVAAVAGVIAYACRRIR